MVTMMMMMMMTWLSTVAGWRVAQRVTRLRRGQGIRCLQEKIGECYSSRRMQAVDPPFIEDVLDRYGDLPNLTKLALGSSHWTPPQVALDSIVSSMHATSTHKYNSILGMDPLRQAMREHLLRISKHAFPSVSDNIMVTAGANQAMINVALALCDPGDNALLLAPFYFSHSLALQMANVNVHTSSFHESTLLPDWDQLEANLSTLKPKLLVVTNPNNPSGKVLSTLEIERIINLCRKTNTWIVWDQTYYEFLFDHAQHVFPSSVHAYDKMVHIFSMSKAFGMPGWRVGFLVCPDLLTAQMRKIQDTIPTHAAVMSQQLALECLRRTYDSTTGENVWFAAQLESLQRVRERIWPIVERMGTVKTSGAFYFLVPVPEKIAVDEAVDILARDHQVLLMPGTAFGAPRHMRLSYGSISEEEVIQASHKLDTGFNHLLALSKERIAANNAL